MTTGRIETPRRYPRTTVFTLLVLFVAQFVGGAAALADAPSPYHFGAGVLLALGG